MKVNFNLLNGDSWNDNFLEVTVRQYIQPKQVRFELINATKFGFTGGEPAADDEKPRGIFFNALPSTEYKVILHDGRRPYVDNPGRFNVKGLISPFTIDHSFMPLVLYFR